jgi:hypothetical protein
MIMSTIARDDQARHRPNPPATRRAEGRIGAIELGEGRRMKFFETIDELAQLGRSPFVGGLVSLAALRATRALSFAVNLCVAKLIPRVENMDGDIL